MKTLIGLRGLVNSYSAPASASTSSFTSTDRAVLNGINSHTDDAVKTVTVPTKGTLTLS